MILLLGRVNPQVSNYYRDIVHHALLGLPPLDRLVDQEVNRSVRVVVLIVLWRHHDLHDFFVGKPVKQTV